jgi:hypothetical protein
MKKLMSLFIFLGLAFGLINLGLLKTTAMAQGLTVLENADEVRFMYWVINGPPGGSYPPGRGGPPGGLLGLIREITGPTALGGGLINAGYTSCTSIPSSGSVSMTGAEGTYTMTFGTPTKTIPTGWPNAGETYEKRVTVDLDGTTFLDIEFNCSTTAGWMRFFEPTKPQATARNLELYFDTTDTNDTRLELYMYYEPNGSDTDMPDLSNEYFIAKFDTDANNVYKIWLTRAAEEAGNKQGFRITIHGSTSLAPGGLAKAHMFFEDGSYTNTATEVTSDTDNIGSGDIDCIDFNDGGTPLDGGTTCDDNGLTLSEAGAPIIDSSGDFSISWVVNTLKSKMSTLP